MKTSPLRLRGLLLAALLPVLAIFARAAEPAAVIYHRESGFQTGWSAIPWGQLEPRHSKAVAVEGGVVSLEVKPLENAAGYAGLQLAAGMTGAIPLTEQLRASGEVHLWLRNGDDPAGQPAFDQMIQVMLAFQPAGGKVINGKYEQVLLNPTPTDGKGSSGWQLVKLSIPAQLGGRVDAATPVKLRAVYLQYVDQPQAAFHVGSCTIEAGPAK